MSALRQSVAFSEVEAAGFKGECQAAYNAGFGAALDIYNSLRGEWSNGDVGRCVVQSSYVNGKVHFVAHFSPELETEVMSAVRLLNVVRLRKHISETIREEETPTRR